MFGDILQRLLMCQLQAEVIKFCLSRYWNICNYSELQKNVGIVFVLAELNKMWEVIDIHSQLTPYSGFCGTFMLMKERKKSSDCEIIPYS